MAANRLNKSEKKVVGINLNLEVIETLDNIGETLNSSRSQVINQIVEALKKENFKALELYSSMSK